MATSAHSRCVAVSNPRVGNNSSFITPSCLASGSPQLPSSCASFHYLSLISLPILPSLRLPSAAPSAFPRSAKIKLYRSSAGKGTFLWHEWNGLRSTRLGGRGGLRKAQGFGFSARKAEDLGEVSSSIRGSAERRDTGKGKRRGGTHGGVGGESVDNGLDSWRSQGWDDDTSKLGGADTASSAYNGGGYSEDERNVTRTVDQLMERFESLQQQRERGAGGAAIGGGMTRFEMDDDEYAAAAGAGAGAGGAVITARDLARLFDHPIDKFQRVAIEAFLRGSSVVVCAPTSSGKTLVGEAAAAATMARGGRLIYTTPLKALSNQKLRDFRVKFGEGNVGLLTGDVAVNRDAPILVMTTEILRNMLYTSKMLCNRCGVAISEMLYTKCGVIIVRRDALHQVWCVTIARCTATGVVCD
ncbi:unnamed protein product [Closterium sp. Yama58-4]|nr:unnamed protein product [Closterium sp. Yama58-4]